MKNWNKPNLEEISIKMTMNGEPSGYTEAQLKEDKGWGPAYIPGQPAPANQAAIKVQYWNAASRS